MKLLVTTNARLYKAPDGKFYTNLVYNYEFFLRYLKVFDEIILVAHVENCNNDLCNKIRVDGPHLFVYEVPFPHGKIDYIKKYLKIQKSLMNCFNDCDAAILRIPDQLAFQLYPILKRNNIPVGVEVTSDSWDFFSSGAVKSFFRPFLRFLWHYQQKYICETAYGTAYVTKHTIQNNYPPLRAIQKRGFTTYYTNATIYEDQIYPARIYNINREEFVAIHVSGSISGYAKGHKELIEAIGMLVEKNINMKLVLIGDGSLNSEITSIIKKYKLKNRIRFAGRLTSSAEIRKELNNADIFVFPSYREGLPRVVIEAMACGLPCIATKLPGITELLDDDCLIPIKDSTSLMHKLEKLFKNPEQLNQMSKRNVEVVKEYGINIIEKKRTEFYTEIKKLCI